jgi:hypothetical protein
MQRQQSSPGTTCGMQDPRNIKPLGDIPRRASLIHASVLSILILALSIELYAFARTQDIWIDESTQLSGITAKLWEMLHWLSGKDLDRFGVPGDRMPPISYVLDWFWLRLFGPSELGFRLFHSAFVIAGSLVLAVITRREMGQTAATVALLFLVLSPKLIQTGVEIRAYPIFFAITCVQVAVFLQLVPESRSRLPDAKSVDLTLLTVFGWLCLIAIYTHFYGVVSTCAFFLALGLAYSGSSSSLIALAVVFVFLIIGSSGLVPFVTSAIVLSPATMVKEQAANQYLTYLLRLFGDSANMVLLPAAFLFLSGTSALLVLGAIPAFVRMWSREARSFDWLYVVVSAGAVVPILASLVVTRFNVVSPSYSGWIFAPLALLVGAGAASSTGFRLWDKPGRFAAIAATITGGLISTYFFLAHASMFVHGPQRFVGAIFDRIEGPKAIVYEDGASWGYSYFPLVFSHSGKIIQYRAADGQVQQIRARAGGSGADGPTLRDIVWAVAPYNHLIVVNTQPRTYRDLRACQGLGGSCPRLVISAIGEKLVETGQWRESRVERSFGLYDTRVMVLDRITESCRATLCR